MKSKLRPYHFKLVLLTVTFLNFNCQQPKNSERPKKTDKEIAAQLDSINLAIKKAVETPKKTLKPLKNKGIASVKIYGREDIISITLKEPKVLHAVLTDSKVLYAAVIDDGSNRNGFAEYLCQLFQRSDVSRVKVVKYKSINDPNRDNAYGVLLGESNCRF